MSWLALSASFGILLAQWQHGAPRLAPAALAAVAVAAAWLVGTGRRGSRAVLLLATLLALTGYLWSAGQIRLRLADRLLAPAAAGEVEFDAWVADLPQASNGIVHLLLETSDAARAQGVPHRVALSLKPAASSATIHGGACLHLAARLQDPHALLNFRGFDGEAWWWAQGIRATGRVRAVRPCLDFRAPPEAAIQRLRDAIRARLQAALGERPATGILVALAVGDQGGVTPAQWNVLWRSGVGHLVSISGLHVTLLAALLRRLVEWGWRRSARACRACPASRAGAVVGFLAALAYALLAGFGIPTRRTLFMLVAAWLAAQRGLLPGGLRIFWLAVVATLFSDPFACWSPGFWLSFGAVGGLILADAGRFGRLPAWRSELQAQWISTLSLLPGVALWFGQLSLVAPLANLLAIPLVGMLVTPLVLVAMVPGLEPCARVAAMLLEPLLVLLGWMAGPAWAAIDLPAPDLAGLLLALAGVLVLLHSPLASPPGWRAACAVLPLCWTNADAVPERTARIEVVDIGQGLSVLVRTRGHLLVFDTGPRWPGGDAGTRTLLPLLRAEGAGRVDRLILSHPDADHVGGADALQKGLPVLATLAGFPRPGARACVRGEHWRWDGVDFDILYPPGPQPDGAVDGRARTRAHDRNNHACVLRVHTAAHAVLLPADIEAVAEAALVRAEAPGEGLRSDVVVVAHHGSRTSSTPDFIAATAARLAIISVGWHNHYHHPHPAVVTRWAASAATVLRTDEVGAVRVQLTPAGIALECAVAARSGYWRARTAEGPCRAS